MGAEGGEGERDPAHMRAEPQEGHCRLCSLRGAEAAGQSSEPE